MSPVDPATVPVVLVHGALRGRSGMIPTAWALRPYGITARPFGYRTRIGTLRDHARRLSRFLDQWLGDYRPPVLGFLTHSMGGLVVRAYLAHEGDRHAPAQRVVMLSPPNRGSALAQRGRNNPAFRWLYGQAVEQLQPEAVRALPPPPESARVLVLAGGRGDPRGYNPALDGDDDGVVAIAEMGLDTTDPRLVPEFMGGIHGLLQWRPAVLRRAGEFLAGSD